MADHLAAASAVALDTESDSLHHFPEKVCLLQVAHSDGAIYLTDPLVLSDLAPLRAMCADPAVVKVFHGASYDLASLKRDFGFTFCRLFDTMVAAQFLGLPELGLDALRQRYFGVAPGPSRQKDDWASRPLTAEQEAYAAADVRHLLRLREALLAGLSALGRVAWVEEECVALEETPAAARVFDPEGYLALKGARELDGRGRAVLRELFGARETWAHEFGRPPFRLLGNESMLAVATQRPETVEALLRIPGCTPRVVGRLGERILAAVRGGLALPEGALPIPPRRPPRPHVSPELRRRADLLAAWRTAIAADLGIEAGVFLPKRLIERIAETAPQSVEDLERVEGLRRWRRELFGREIVAAATGRPAGGPVEAARGGRVRG
jgi:ribonuclease D